MKKALLLAAAAVVLASCGNKQYTWEDLVFDYPALYKLNIPEDKDGDPATHLFFIEDGLENSLEFIAIDIVKEDPGSIEGADEDILVEYLAEKAFDNIKTIALDDEDYQLYDKTSSLEEVSVDVNPETGLLESHAYAKGNWEGEGIFVEAYSTTFDGRYTISMVAQSQHESYLKTLIDIYRSVHVAEAKAR